MHKAAQMIRSLESLARQAFCYAKQGLQVLPIWPRGKNPLTSHGVKDATTDLPTIENWWRRWPDANIALAVPAGFLVLDVDSPDALGRLKAQDFRLPSTTTARTSRGSHFWYSVSCHVKNGVGILPGVDIRAAGGYVIVPPSVHPSGAIYRWEVPLDRESISECPEWLLELLAKRGQQRHGRPTDNWHEVISKPVPEGRRNQTLAEVAGLLFRRLPASVAAEFAYCWAQVRMSPPLSDRETRRTLDSIADRELRRRGGQP